MANILHKTESFRKDPFSQSDRDPIGRHSGKGDRQRGDASLQSARLSEIVFPEFTKGFVPVAGKPGRVRKTYK